MSIFRRAVSGLRKLILGRVRGDGGSQGVSLPSVGMRMEENNLTPTTRVVDGTIRYADTIPRNTIQTGDKYGLTLNGTNEYGTGPARPLPATLGVSFWLKTSTSTDAAVFSQYESVGSQRAIWVGVSGTTTGAIQVVASSDGGTSNRLIRVYTTPVNDGEWHHVHVKLDGTDLSVHIDGAFDAVATNSDTGSYTSIFKQSINWMIGMSGLSGGTIYNAFPGSLDDIRVYGTTLLPAEIQALAASAPGDPPVETESLPLLHYKFEDAVTSTTITNDGVLENADLALTGNSVMNMRDQVGYLGFSDNTGFGDIRPLKPKYGLTLNGTNEYGTLAAAKLPLLGNTYTLSAWVNFTGAEIGGAVFGHSAHTLGGGYCVIFRNTLIGFIAKRAGLTTDAFYGETDVFADLADTGWHHMACIFGVSSDGMVLSITTYLDGVEIPFSLISDAGSYGDNATAPYYVGARQGTSVHYGGDLDDIRIFDTALPESEIKALAAVKPGGTPPTTSATPLIHYTFEDPVSSPIVKNVGSLANADLTLTGVLANMRAQTGYVSFANSVGYGASFTTNGTNGQYLDTGLTLSNDVAFTVWRRARYLSTNGYDLDGFWNNGGEAVRLGRDNGNNQIYVNLGDQVADTPGVTIPNNELHTMCIQSSTTGNEKLWLNGVKLKDAASSMSAFTGQNISYKIGLQHSTSGGLGHNSHAEYYEYLIAKRVLTEDELEWLDSGGTYGTPIDFLNDPDILVYYDFEKEHPDFVYNRANPSLPGIIVGGEWSTVPRSSVDTNKDVQQAGSSYRSAVSFPGSTNKVDFGSVLIGATDDFDISFDFKADTLADEMLFSQHTSAVANRMSLIMFSTGAVQLYVASTPAVLILSGGGLVKVGRWHTLRATRTGDAFALYFDGTLVGTQTQAGVSVLQKNTMLGTDDTSIDDFHGLISNVTIDGTSYLTRPDETIAGATPTNASYVNVVRGRPGTLTHTGIVPRDRVLTNRAVALNGTSESITLPVDLSSPSSWSFACRIKTTGSLESIMDARDANDDGFRILWNAGNLAVSSDATDLLFASDDFDDGEWHYLEVDWDGATATAKLDGITIGSGALSAPSSVTRTNVICGRYFNSSGGWLDGQIADIEMYVDGTKVGTWPMCEPSGTICYDVSGNNNHGTGAPATRTGTQNLIDTHMTDGYSVATWFDGTNDWFVSSANVTGASDALSIACKFSVDDNINRIMIGEATTFSGSYGWWIGFIATNKIRFLISNNGTSFGYWDGDAAAYIGDSKLHTLSCVYSNGAPIIKIDGSTLSLTATNAANANIINPTPTGRPLAIGSRSSGDVKYAGILSQVVLEAAAWTPEEAAGLLLAGKASEVAAIRPNAWYFPDAKTEVLQGLPALTVNGAPEQRVIPAGVGLPPISYGPGVLAPGQSLDLYCGEDDAPYSIGLSDHLVDGDYDFGDGSEGDILFVSGDDNHEKLVLLDDATDYPELFE